MRDRYGSDMQQVTGIDRLRMVAAGTCIGAAVIGAVYFFVRVGALIDRSASATRESEKKFRAVFCQAAVGIGRVSFTDARWIDVNDAFCRMLGYSPEEMLAIPWPEMTHPDDVDLDLVPFRRMATGELETYSVEKRFIHREGRHVWARLSLSLVRDAVGRPDYEIAIIEDITKRRRAEESLREREQQLHLFIEHAPAALAMFDRDMRYLYASRRWLKAYAPRERDLRGLSHYDVFPEITEAWKEFHCRGLAGETLRAEAERFQRLDGSVQWVRWEIRPWYESWGNVGGIVIFAEDLTDMKRAEEDLKKTVQDLERSNRELQQFAYVASHDLQEPLRTVTSYAQLLQKRYRGQLDEKAGSYISYVVEAAERMSALIRDLLEYSLVSSEEKRSQPVSMEAVLERAVENLSPMIRESGADISHGPLPEVTGDSGQLMRLFQNLLENAVKYRNRDVPLRVHVSAARQNGEWVFGVRDNGIGLDPQFYDRIFRMFQRLHQREEYAGTGMGLAICRKIVERHSGRMWVESTHGEGSTFYFALPVMKGESYAP